MGTSTAPQTRVASLAGFRWLLSGQAISAVGSQVTFIALPLIAATALEATPLQMGILGALDNLPYLLFGLGIGALVDRHRRRPLMIGADLLRALSVASIPLAALVWGSGFWHLCAVAFVVGIGNILFDVACQAQMPDLVGQKDLVRANGALQTASGLAALGAPGLVGLFIGTVGAPIAMVADAASYLASALTIIGVERTSGDEGALHPTGDSAWADIVEGVRTVIADRRLAGIGAAGALVSIGMNAAFAVLILELSRTLGLGPLGIGLVFFTFALFGATGAIGAETIAGCIPVGALLAAGPVLGGLGLLAFAGAGRIGTAPLVLAHLGAALAGFGLMLEQALAAGLRQGLAPDAARGRVLGTLRFVEWGVMPIGSLLGGFVGEALGTSAALGASAVIVALAAAPILATPLIGMRDLPGDDSPAVG